MKDFVRKNRAISLCGLNCALCPMLLGGYCGGCGNGNQTCKIAACSLEHGGIEHCILCGEYPCKLYEGADEYDSFITHLHRKADMEKWAKIGEEAYQKEQNEKAQILRYLLNNFNDGRKKTIYCIAVNLLKTDILKGVLDNAEKAFLEEWTIKEKADLIAAKLQEEANAEGIILKLRKKPKEQEDK